MIDGAVTDGTTGGLHGWQAARHAVLDALGTDLWCAVPDGDEAWVVALRGFGAHLQQHVTFEEAWLLPRWAQVPGAPANASAAVVAADHELLRAILQDAAAAKTPLDRARAAAHLLDVLHHHDLRETSAMVPHLDATVPAEEVARWLARAAAEEAALPPRSPPPLDRRGAPTTDPALAAATDAPLRLPRLVVPAHPKGPRRVAAVEEAVARALAASDPRERRVAWLAVWGAWRLYRLVGGG